MRLVKAIMCFAVSICLVGGCGSEKTAAPLPPPAQTPVTTQSAPTPSQGLSGAVMGPVPTAVPQRQAQLSSVPTQQSVPSPPDQPSVAAPSAKSEDIEVKGNFTTRFNFGSTQYQAKGTVTNTGNATAPRVTVVVEFKGGVCVSGEQNPAVHDPDLVLGAGSDEFKNLRSGETRQFQVEAQPFSDDQLRDTLYRKYGHGMKVWDYTATSCGFAAYVQ